MSYNFISMSQLYDLTISGSGTGSGTSSYAISASYANTAETLLGNIESASYALTSSYFSGIILSSSYSLTSSYALTASYISGSSDNSISSSYSFSSSYSDLALTSSYALTASYIEVINIQSSSYALSSSYSDYSLTASYALNGGGGSGGGTISGSGTSTFIPQFTGSSAIGNSLAKIDSQTFTVLGNIAIGSAGGLFRAYNQDSVKLKFTNWYLSNSDQYGQGQLFHEIWFGAIKNYYMRRIGFYLELPNAGAPDSAGNPFQHPTNARMYIDINGVYMSGSLKIEKSMVAQDEVLLTIKSSSYNTLLFMPNNPINGSIFQFPLGKGGFEFYNYRFLGTDGTYGLKIATKASTNDYFNRVLISGNTNVASLSFINSNIAINKIVPNEKFDLLGNALITGSITASEGFFGTASYALYALTASYTEGINSQSSSYALSSSYAVTASYALNNLGKIFAGGYATQSFTNQVTWSFAHNLNREYVSFEIYNSNNEVQTPQSIVIVDSNNANIYFNTSQSGVAVATFGGNYVTSSYALTASYFSGSDIEAIYAETSSYSTTSSYSVTASYAESPKILMFAISDEITEFTASTNVFQFRMPFDMYLTEVRATVNYGGNSHTSSFDINKNGNSILSTTITIDPNESSSFNAINPPVISTPELADNDLISIDIDVAATGSKGAKIIMKGY